MSRRRRNSRETQTRQRTRKPSTGFRELHQESEAAIRSCEVKRIAALVDRSTLVATVDEILTPNGGSLGGRPRLVPTRSMMILFILTAVHDDNLLFRSMLKTGTRSISGYDQLDLGFITRDRSIVLNYDHIRKLFNTLDTRLHPSKQPSEVEAGAALFEFINELVAVSVPHNIAWSGAHSIDATSVQAWGINKRTKTKDGEPKYKNDGKPVVRADKDARAGYCTPRGQVRPQGKDGKSLFYGYDAHFACATPSVRGSIADQPELITSVSVVPASTDVADAAMPMIDYLAYSPFGLTEILADRAYTYKTTDRWLNKIRAYGAEQVADMHENDHGATDFNGAQMIAGRAHCACTPPDLAKIVKPGPIAARENNGKAFIEFTGRLATREQYEATTINNNADGSQRVGCPALGGKVACARRPETMGVSDYLPIVNTNGVDLSDVPMCNQKTTTITAAARGKMLQKERYGSAAWILSFNRRSSGERKNGFLKDPADGLITRGKWRVHGVVKNALMVALAVVAHNIHSARVWALKYNQQHVDPVFLESDPEYSVSLTQTDIDRFEASRAPPSKAA